MKVQANKSGKRYAIVRAADATFGVYAECSNYSGRAAGGIARTWRYCEKGLTREAAETLFARKVAGKAQH